MAHEPTKKGILIIERMLKVDKRKEEDEVLQGLRPPPPRVITKSFVDVELLYNPPDDGPFAQFREYLDDLQAMMFRRMSIPRSMVPYHKHPVAEDDDG